MWFAVHLWLPGWPLQYFDALDKTNQVTVLESVFFIALLPRFGWIRTPNVSHRKTVGAHKSNPLILWFSFIFYVKSSLHSALSAAMFHILKAELQTDSSYALNPKVQNGTLHHAGCSHWRPPHLLLLWVLYWTWECRWKVRPWLECIAGWHCVDRKQVIRLYFYNFDDIIGVIFSAFKKSRRHSYTGLSTVLMMS